MEDSIRNFAEQFSFNPEIENKENLKKSESFVVGGMGGSNLASGVFTRVYPDINLTAHRDYSLPNLSEQKLKNSLFIACSFSGNTEETLDFLEKALEKNLNTAVITKGGKLLDIAREKKLPLVKIPDTGIQPRVALGFLLIALASFVKNEALSELKELSRSLHSLSFESEGENLAEKIKNKVPIIYASRENLSLARIWKIKFNETAKIPAFFNVFPELNHNEMTGFDHNEQNFSLSEKFVFIFLKDNADNPHIQKRMEVTRNLLTEKNLPVQVVEMSNENVFSKVLNCVLLSDWTALHTASFYSVDPDKVPMVEKFKKLI